MTFDYYIYAYLRDDGTPYYIGKGKFHRAYNRKNHNIKPPLNRNLIIIMESNLSEIGALALERFYIRWYGRKDLGSGILRNKTDGGDGISGFIFSEESKRKMSEKLLGNKKCVGRILSKETRIKIGIKSKGRIVTKETREKLRAAHLGKKLKPFTEEHKRNISMCQRGKKLTEIHKQKISDSLKRKKDDGSKY